MSHFIVNMKEINKIMEDNSLSNDEKDLKLCEMFGSKIKGGPEMLKKTKKWIYDKYPETINSFKLLMELK